MKNLLICLVMVSSIACGGNSQSTLDSSVTLPDALVLTSDSSVTSPDVFVPTPPKCVDDGNECSSDNCCGSSLCLTSTVDVDKYKCTPTCTADSQCLTNFCSGITDSNLKACYDASCGQAYAGFYNANCVFTKNGVETHPTEMARECGDLMNLVKTRYPKCLVKYNIYLNCLSRTVYGMKCETRCLAEEIAFEGCVK